MPPKKVIQKHLGQLLVDAKLITQEQLDAALKLQEEKGGLIGQVLVGQGVTTEEAIAKALTAQYGFPYMPLAGYEMDVAVVKLIPENVARQYEMIAVDRMGNVLTLAMSNPLNNQAIEDIEMITKCRIQTFVSTSTDIKDSIAKYYK